MRGASPTTLHSFHLFGTLCCTTPDKMSNRLKQVFHKAGGVSYEALQEEKKALVSSGGA